MKNFYCFKLIHNRIFIGISLLLISFFGFLNFASAEISGKEQISPSVFYVNDATTEGDHFFTAVGTLTGDGTIGNPCSRINDAISKASSGDTIYVNSGNYNYLSEGSPVPAGLIKVTKGVVIKAVPETRPIIDGTGADGVFKIHPSALSDGNCVVIEGFEITGDPATGIAITMQGCYQVTPAKVIIKDNWVHGMIAGINFWGARNFLPPGSTGAVGNVEIYDNKFYNLGVSGSYEGCGVLLEDLLGWNYVGNDYAAKIYNNEFSNIYAKDASTPGAGIAMARADSVNEASNMYIYNNKFMNLPIGVGVMDGDATYTKLRNNTFNTCSVAAVFTQNLDNSSKVDATLNWWGNASGPYHSTNSSGTGHDVSDNVTYSPWLGLDPGAMPSEHMTYVVNATSTIQAAIDAAISGDIVKVLNGTYSESVTLKNGVILSPGASPACITVADLNAVSTGGTLLVEADGATPCTEYDQVTVTNTVDLSNVVLSLVLGYAPLSGGNYTIINNTSGNAITGTFTGLAEGAMLTAVFNSVTYTFQISYIGGTGNDVILTYNDKVKVYTDNTKTTLVSTHGTIQAAINASTTLAGYFVEVSAGTYTEQLLIQKNLTLTGAGIGQTIVQPPTGSGNCVAGITGVGTNWETDYLLAAYPTDWNGTAATGTPIQVKVDGFTFDANNTTHSCGSRYTGVFFGCVKGTNYADAGLFNSSVINFGTTYPSATGVRILGDSKLSVKDCDNIEYTINGIAAYGDLSTAADPDVLLDGNTMICSLTTLSGNDEYALNVCFGSTGTVSNNTVTDASIIGVLVSSSNGVTITNNTISNQTSGIYLYYSNSATVTGNNLSVMGWGIILSNANSCFIGTALNGNNISTCYGAGIDVYNSNTNSLLKNTITGVNSGSTSTIGNAGWGIGVEGTSASNTIGDGTCGNANTITNNDASIVFYGAGTGNTAKGNSFSNNMPYGLNNYGGAVVDATLNWWGSATGPTNATLNPCGTGDPLTDATNVTFEPWQSDASCTNQVYLLDEFIVSGTATICAGGNTNITLSGSQLGTNYVYKLYKDGTLVTGSETIGTGSSLSWNVTESTAGVYTYTVTATNTLDGCVLNMIVSATITVNDLPMISFGVDGVEASYPIGTYTYTYCYDFPVQVITLYHDYAGKPPYSITYNINGDSPVTKNNLRSDSIIISRIFTPGTYIITITDIVDSNGCHSSADFLEGCVATLQINPDIEPPVISTCPEYREYTTTCDTLDVESPAFSSAQLLSSYAEFSGAPNNGVATDNCAIKRVYYRDAITGFYKKTITRTWTLVDSAGNSSSCNQTILLNPPCTGLQVTDINSNTYDMILVGTSCWTKQNMKNLSYAAGSAIPVAKAYYAADYPDSTANVATYGRLYSWYSAVNVPEGSTTAPSLTSNGHVQGICPDGWYMPENEHYREIMAYGADALKSETNWLNGLNGSNSTGFSGLPAGYYNASANAFYLFLGNAGFWSATYTVSVEGPCYLLEHTCPDFLFSYTIKGNGYSVRCVKECE